MPGASRVPNSASPLKTPSFSERLSRPPLPLPPKDRVPHQRINRRRGEEIVAEAPQLASLLKEMKDGLDVVRIKVQALTAKVTAGQFPTTDGISYLEAKHLLLLNYCQSLVYYLLRKAKGFSIHEHPVVQSLVEIRLFLEKIRPIDKKLQYQIQKLSKVSVSNLDSIERSEKKPKEAQESEDLLRYRPNPDNLIKKTEETRSKDNIYRPPKIAPALMDEDKISREERNALRKEKHALRKTSQSDYMRDMINDLEGKPEEFREAHGIESREATRFAARMEDRARREEDLFIRAPLSKEEKKMERNLKKSRNGLMSLTDDFYDEIKALGVDDENDNQMGGFSGGGGSIGTGRFKKRKRKF